MSIVLTVLFAAMAMIIIEQLKPGRYFSNTKAWLIRAVAFSAVQAASAYLAANTWDYWFSSIQIVSLASYSMALQVAVGYLLITFIYYWWHRARHEIPFLWRWIHQIHHSPVRLEVLTSFYKHPLEIILNSILSSFILSSILGLHSQAIAISVLITGLAELFYHWNVKTPHWLGYFIQRPESHCIHHQRGKHCNNYSDLPLWDMLFGTFENPAHQTMQCGFINNRELSILKMLIGIDVNRSKENHYAT